MDAWSNAAKIAVSVFIVSVVVRPGMARYAAWKNDPARVRTASRDLFGRYVTDLWIVRLERVIRAVITLAIIAGIVVTVAFYISVSDDEDRPPVVTLRPTPPR